MGISKDQYSDQYCFVIFINDLPECVTSVTYLFADNTKMSQVIANEKDGEIAKDLKQLDK